MVILQMSKKYLAEVLDTTPSRKHELTQDTDHGFYIHFQFLDSSTVSVKILFHIERIKLNRFIGRIITIIASIMTPRFFDTRRDIILEIKRDMFL